MLGFERMGQLPTRFLTGQFVAARAVRRSTCSEGSHRAWREARVRGVWFGVLAWARFYRRLELLELSLDPPPALRRHRSRSITASSPRRTTRMREPVWNAATGAFVARKRT